MDSPNPRPRGVVVFSGGSAANNLVDVFREFTDSKRCSLSYVIPISDNGGSSSEIIRVIGGPGIGDVRSRLVRLIPDDVEHPDTEKAALRAFFNHRLPSDSDAAKLQWHEIVEARHALWDHISSPKRELMRSFLNVLNMEIVKRIRPSSVFDFSSASIGNLFLTGARLFTGSFESAIYLLSSLCQIPPHVSVLPAINTNFTYHISAGLADGTTITGQNSISHPSDPPPTPSPNNDDQLFAPSPSATLHTNPLHDDETARHDAVEDANLPGSLPSLRRPALVFSKAHEAALPARIERVWYINPYGQEIRPAANAKVVAAVRAASALVYSIGSLYTSILPSLILRGVGDAVARSPARKVLVLNSSIDRETSSASRGDFGAVDFVAAIADACADSRGLRRPVRRDEWRAYVSHVIYLEGPGTPVVEKKVLADLGIETVRVYGRKEGDILKYDGNALVGALEATIGKRDGGIDRSRRNTLEI